MAEDRPQPESDPAPEPEIRVEPEPEPGSTTAPTEPLTAGDPLADPPPSAGDPPADPPPSASDPFGDTPPYGAPGARALGGDSTGQSAPAGIRRLRRTNDDRVLGGVAAGLGRYFGVDPILFRIGFVVASILAGAGALAYLAAWIFLPSDASEPRSGRSRALSILAGGVLAIIALPFLAPVFGIAAALLPLALFVLLVALLVSAVRGNGGDFASVLGKVTLGLLALLATGALILGAGAAAALGGGVVMASLVVAAGVALLVGAFVGGARWLIIPALLIALPVGVVAAADLDVEGGVGERNHRPLSVGELRPGYELGAGELRVDLREVKLPKGETDLRVRMGLGEVIVLVDEKVCVASDVRVGAGAARVLDQESAGLNVDWLESPAAPADVPRLRVDAQVGIGEVRVLHDDPDPRRLTRSGWDDDQEGFELDFEVDDGVEVLSTNAACVAPAR